MCVVQVFDSFSWMFCMSMVLYCVFWAIMCVVLFHCSLYYPDYGVQDHPLLCQLPTC
jgi:hypothetical protein